MFAPKNRVEVYFNMVKAKGGEKDAAAAPSESQYRSFNEALAAARQIAEDRKWFAGNDSKLASAAKIGPSVIGKWKAAAPVTVTDNVRKVCRVLHAHPRELIQRFAVVEASPDDPAFGPPAGGSDDVIAAFLSIRHTKEGQAIATMILSMAESHAGKP